MNTPNKQAEIEREIKENRRTIEIARTLIIDYDKRKITPLDKQLRSPFWKEKILQAELKGINEGIEIGRRNQYEGLCTNCGKPDRFSKDTLCYDCIAKWKVVLENKAKAEALADDKITKLKLKEELGKLMQYCRHNQEALDRCYRIIRLCNLQEIK